MTFFRKLLLLLAVLAGNLCYAQIVVTYPVPRIVVQRNNSNQALLYVTGRVSQPADRMEIRFIPRAGEGGTAIDWTLLQNQPTGGIFYGAVTVTGGRYDMEIRAIKNNAVSGAVTRVEKVGVGEVFLIAGHSNAAGGYSPTIDYAYGDQYKDRVNTIHVGDYYGTWDKYWNSGDPSFLPSFQPTQLCDTCGIAPGVSMRWFWGRAGELIVKNLNVPVLFYSSAFGGTNIEQLYKSAYDIPFEHGFVKYEYRFPYTHIRAAIKKYIPFTGLRAVLCGHGVNDRNNYGQDFKYQYEKVIDKSREETGYPDLAWMVATECYINGECWGQWAPGSSVERHITRAQDELVAQKPEVYKGAQLNLILNDGRNEDALHFNQTGQSKAAEYWRQAVMSENSPSKNFLTSSKPLMAKVQPPVIPAFNIVSVQSGDWDNPATWDCKCIPSYVSTVIVNNGHTVAIDGNAFARNIINRGRVEYKTKAVVQLSQ